MSKFAVRAEPTGWFAAQHQASLGGEVKCGAGRGFADDRVHAHPGLDPDPQDGLHDTDVVSGVRGRLPLQQCVDAYLTGGVQAVQNLLALLLNPPLPGGGGGVLPSLPGNPLGG